MIAAARPRLRRPVSGEASLDLNLAILDWLKKTIKFSGEVSLTDHYQKEYPPDVTDRRNSILPKNFQNQPMGFQYTQVFEDRIGFINNLCILDLLFNCGPEAKTLLRDNILTI